MSEPWDALDTAEDEMPPLEDEETPKRTRRPRSDKGQPRGPRGSTGPRTRNVSNKKLAEDLLDPWAKIAMGLSFVSPTASAVMLKRGEKTTEALVSIASGSPKMLAAMKKVSKIGPGTDLVETVVHIVMAVALDAGRLPFDHPIAMMFGLTDLYVQVHPEVMQTEAPGPEQWPTAPSTFGPPPAFGQAA